MCPQAGRTGTRVRIETRFRNRRSIFKSKALTERLETRTLGDAVSATIDALKAPNDPSPLLTENRSHTVAVEPQRGKITSRHRIDRRSLLPLAARRDAVADCATC